MFYFYLFNRFKRFSYETFNVYLIEKEVVFVELVENENATYTISPEDNEALVMLIGNVI